MCDHSEIRYPPGDRNVRQPVQNTPPNPRIEYQRLFSIAIGSTPSLAQYRIRDPKLRAWHQIVPAPPKATENQGLSFWRRVQHYQVEMNSTRIAHASLLAALIMAIGARSAEFTVVEKPQTDPPNTHYPGSRPPLMPTPLIKLPVGAVRPDGWLRRQLELQSRGFHGHLGELSAFLKKENNAWLSATGEGEHGWEEVPYWLKGFGDCAYLLGDSDQTAEARLWIEAVLRSQREDGYFGPRPGLGSTVSSTTGKYDLWPNMIMLMCLQSYHEVTGDNRVLDLMRRYFKWELSVPESEFLPPYWQKIRAGDNLWSVYWLYNRTGEPWLLDLAEKIHRHTANFTDGIPDWHNVNMSQAFGGPTFFWLQSRDPKHLVASERNWQTIRQMYGQVPGGMFGGDENCRPGYTDPRQAIETCGMVEMMFSCERLLNVTGNPVWADRAEDVAFNSLPAALTADFKALRYLTSPNLIQSDRGDKCPGVQNCGPMFHYDPYSHRCCQHNFGHGWPYLVEHAWMATPGNGLAAVIYGPTTVEAVVANGEKIRIAERTHYPFDETVELTFSSDKPVRFPLYLRVPGWCAKPAVAINGQLQSVSARPLHYLRIDREWRNGDVLRLTLPMEVSLRTWTNNHNSVSVDRGPLTYSLKIGEKWVRAGGTDRWPAWEVYPTTPWNYGLALSENPPSSFDVIKKPWPANDMPFTPENAPVELRAKGRRIIEWQADERDLVGPLQDSPAFSDQPIESITLIPMGAARLRIASFPIASSAANAHRWVGPPPSLPFKATASHCWHMDTVKALKDQRLPANSNDQSIPRFTWWDHKGTREWVQYEFDQIKKISAVEVYWFDDTPGGGCALPESWTVLYMDGSDWKPVPGAKIPAIERDKFNRAEFDPVATKGLRLDVKLRPNYSAGILEWRIIE